MSDAAIQPGDCIHLAVPMTADPARVSRDMVAAYGHVGVRVFMLDHIRGLDHAKVVAVVRGVDPDVRFEVP